MTSASFNEIVSAFQEAHKDIIQFASELSEEEIRWHPHPIANSIAFYLWHLARWSDYLSSSLPDSTPELGKRLGPQPQIWHQEKLATQWELDPGLLGEEESGMDVDEKLAVHLQLPNKATLLDYARRTFARLEMLLPQVNETEFQNRRHQEWAKDTLGHYILAHLRHETEHLGMMQYIHGLYQMTKSSSEGSN